MNTRRLTLSVTKRAQHRIKIHRAWWKENRKDARGMFTKKLGDAYAEIRNNSDVGTKYEDDEVEARRILTETDHWVYYIVTEGPKSKILVVGIQGPGEEFPPDLSYVSSPQI